MRINIKGVKNKDHKKKVDKALDDAGFTACEVDTTLKVLIVPDIYLSELEEIALVLAEVGDYHIDMEI